MRALQVGERVLAAVHAGLGGLTGATKHATRRWGGSGVRQARPGDWWKRQWG